MYCRKQGIHPVPGLPMKNAVWQLQSFQKVNYGIVKFFYSKLMDDDCWRNPANKLLVERLLETSISLDELQCPSRHSVQMNSKHTELLSFSMMKILGSDKEQGVEDLKFL